MAGKCPKCGNLVSRLKISDVTAGVPFGVEWKGVTFDCPACGTVLGAGIDPIAIKTDIINGLMAKLRKE